MITRLQIRNFRSHKESDFTLEPLSVFIGPVASGKSNIFKGLLLLQSTIHRTPGEYFSPGVGGFRYVRTRDAKTTEAIEFCVEATGLEGFPGETARYVIEFVEGPEGIYIAHERLERFGGANGERPGQLVFDRPLKGGQLGQFGFFDPYGSSVLYNAFRRSSTELQDETIRFANSLATLLSSLGYYHLEVSSTRRPSSPDIVPRITYRGDSIPSYLLGIRDTPDHKQLYEAIENDLKELLPNKLKGIRLIPMERGDIGLAFEFEGYDGFLIAPEQSDGTLLTLALLCIIHQPSHPKLLCLEEPENGIHPRRLQWLFDKLVSLAYPEKNQEPVQVLVSSHSPYLVDFFKDRPSAVRVVEGKDGRTTVRSLRDEEVSSDISLGHQWFMGSFGGV